MSSVHPGRTSRAAAAGLAVLRDRVRRIARTGRLRVAEERAVDLIHAMGTGVVLALLEKPPEDRGGLSEAAREAVFATIISEQSQVFETGPAGTASALRAGLDDIAVLTLGERQLLCELLELIAGTS